MVKQTFTTRLAAAGLLALAALACFFVTTAQAGPPAPVDIPLTQPDGTTVTVRQWGDERQHGLETLDGYTLVRDEASGFYAYAVRAEDGTLVPAQAEGKLLIAGQDSPLGLMPQARPELPPEVESLFSAPAVVDASAGPPVQASGDRPMLVLLVKFNNQANTYTADAFQQKIFGATSSVRDYYQQASFGKLTFIPAAETLGTAGDGVVGWLALNMPHPNLNYSGPYYFDYLVAASESIAHDALTKANEFVDFSRYDSDGDGYVTAKELQIVIVAAGFDQSFNPLSGPGLWAHQRDLSSSLWLDGVYLGQGSPDGDWGGYSLFGERHGDHIAQIGVMAHEIGHLLGWPDLYDTDTRNWEGAGNWSVMGSGSWNKTSNDLYGDSPALPDAWLKSYMDWIAPIQVYPNGTRTLVPKASANPSALLVGGNPAGVDWRFYASSGTGQYWLVENRQRTGYDAGLPGCGLLIWHVHEDVSPYNNANGNPYYPLLALEQADGYGDMNFYHPFDPLAPYNPPYSNRGDAGDPYPGMMGRTRFGPDTSPNSSYSNVNGTFTASNYTVYIESAACADWMYVNVRNDSMVVALDQKVYLPLVPRGALSATGTVLSNGAPLAGQTVQMLYSSGPGQPFVAYGTPSVTDAAGKYFLPLPPLFAAETKYLVFWANTTGDPLLLSRFECNPRSGMDTAHTCDMQVSGINLRNPIINESIYFPRLFEWTARPFTTDRYGIQFFDAVGASLGFYGYFSYGSSGTVFSAPGTAKINTDYKWTVRVITPNGWGLAFERRPIRFNDLSSPPLEQSPGLGWNEP